MTGLLSFIVYRESELVLIMFTVMTSDVFIVKLKHSLSLSLSLPPSLPPSLPLPLCLWATASCMHRWAYCLYGQSLNKFNTIPKLSSCTVAG